LGDRSGGEGGIFIKLNKYSDRIFQLKNTCKREREANIFFLCPIKEIIGIRKLFGIFLNFFRYLILLRFQQREKL
jgi:hypothetical protein